MAVRDTHVFVEIGMIRVIVDHGHDLCGKFSRTPATEKIEQAVGLLTCENGNPRHHIGEAQLSGHRERFCDG